MTTQNFPPGWDDERVKRLIEHSDSVTEEEQVIEDEAAHTLSQNREFLELIERSRAHFTVDRGISSEEMRARFE